MTDLNASNLISGVQAVRLYQLIRKTSSSEKPNLDEDEAIEEISIHNTCRICRCDSTINLIKCSCGCKGTMGYVHEKCLRRWNKVRRSNICEICNEQQFEIYSLRDPVNYKEWAKNLFKRRYFLYRFIKDLINLMVISTMVVCNANQSLEFLDRIALGDYGSFEGSLYFNGLLLYSGYLFYMYFDWVVRTMMKMRSALTRLSWYNMDDELDEEDFDEESLDFNDFFLPDD